MTSKPIIRHLGDITAIPTSHQAGTKRQLLQDSETDSAITQIAVATLLAGEKVEEHTHPTMDEHFIFRAGKAILTIHGDDIQRNEAECRELMQSEEAKARKAKYRDFIKSTKPC